MNQELLNTKCQCFFIQCLTINDEAYAIILFEKNTEQCTADTVTKKDSKK